MCFATSIAANNRKLFIAAAAASATTAVSGVSASATETAQASRSSTNHAEKKGSGSAAKTKMSRSSKSSRIQTEVCGDCGASDPSWASINRGILLCSDCCSVHRSLGRHISIVKSLHQGTWEPSVLNFVNSLNAHGANSVWEHHLLDGQNAKGANRMRKPNAKDSLHPVKSDFIKAKHMNLAFVLKPNLQEEDDVAGSNLEQELSKQLHASVRTSNLETSLRLLVQGADPNFFHEEKRSTPLHVAAKFGQASQIELLLIYGGNVNAIDGNGLTPLEVAKANKHNTIGERLHDAMFEVTDRIIMFLGGKKPDHATGRHLVIPESNCGEISEQLKIARGRLQLVPNKMFEELVSDLYDEVDRRESEAIWATSSVNADNVAVPFLPANPFLSATRNQGRQKLARFSRAEFAGLLTDVLIDARRRQNMANLTYYNPTMTSPSATTATTTFNSSALGGELDPNNLSDDEPIYDPVASDDDYAAVPPMAQQALIQQLGLLRSPTEPSSNVNALEKQIREYKNEISQLKTVVLQLSSENTELKSKFNASGSGSIYDEPLRIDLNDSEPTSQHNNNNNCNGKEPLTTAEVAAAGGGSNSSSASSSANNSNQSTIKRPASMYERRMGSAFNKASSDARTTTSMYQMPGAAAPAVGGVPALSDELKLRTDLVTRRLKDLIICMQEASSVNALVPCAERIRQAVVELVAVFPTTTNCAQVIRDMLTQLNRYTLRIQQECENLKLSYDMDNKADIEKYIKEVRDCAYHIASATKTLISQVD